MSHTIVLGNEKGGSGKSTTAMHIMSALTRSGYTVGAIDLDLRQQSLFRYLDNRESFMNRKGITLPMPERAALKKSKADSEAAARAEEEAQFASALMQLQAGCQFVIIDCPGSHTHYAQMAHTAADTLITPMNDSLVDFDLLARLDPADGRVIGPSVYSEMVWSARQKRAENGLAPLDWIVLRNRLSSLDARNKRRVATALNDLAKRIGFRLAPGFTERVIFREMFLSGLTLLDLKADDSQRLNMSNIAARQEVRALMQALNLPNTKIAI